MSNSLDPDQARHFVGPDLSPNCLQKLSADGEPDKTSRDKNIPCHFFTPRTKHPTKICHPGQNIPRCFCHPGHNIPCLFCHPGHNIPCHFCHPGQKIPYSDCFFKVSLICDLHLLWHVLAVNALVWLSKWYKLDLKLIERQFHNVNRI